MRLQAAGYRKLIFAGCSGAFLVASLWTSALQAQTAPEMLRINVIPAKPGIRSVTLAKRYKPIINRDDEGVVVDTLGSSETPPPCETPLEVTLENSRVLHRMVNICTGNTVTVDVNAEEKPGNARVIQGVAGVVSAKPKSNGVKTPSFVSPSATAPTATPNGAVDANGAGQPATTPSAGGTFSKDGVEGSSLPVLGAEPQEQPAADITAEPADSAAGLPDAQNVLVTPSDQRVWKAEPGNFPGAMSTLVHGVPETDDVDFFASCQTQSGNGLLVLSQTPGNLREGSPLSVRIGAGTFNATYDAIGSSTNNQFGQSFPQVTLLSKDALWEAMIRESELTIEVEGLPAYTVSLKGSANAVRLFVATCAPAQQIVSDAALPNANLEPGSDASCDQVGNIRSREGNTPGQIVFRNNSQQAVDVHWVDYSGSERSYARLQPGQILEQQTFVSHAWVVRGVDGSCRGVYITRTPFREVVITGRGQPPLTSGPSFGLPTEPAYPTDPVPPADIGPNTGLDRNNFQSPNGTVADYLCTGGVDLQVTFSANGQTAKVAEMGYGVVTLNREAGASTMRYSSGQGHVLQGQPDNATWARPGLRDVFCARR